MKSKLTPARLAASFKGFNLLVFAACFAYNSLQVRLITSSLPSFFFLCHSTIAGFRISSTYGVDQAIVEFSDVGAVVCKVGQYVSTVNNSLSHGAHNLMYCAKFLYKVGCVYKYINTWRLCKKLADMTIEYGARGRDTGHGEGTGL